MGKDKQTRNESGDSFDGVVTTSGTILGGDPMTCAGCGATVYAGIYHDCPVPKDSSAPTPPYGDPCDLCGNRTPLGEVHRCRRTIVLPDRSVTFTLPIPEEQTEVIYDTDTPSRLTLPKEYEAVEHPQHYNLHPAGIECIDVIEAFPSNIAMVIKHLWRAGLKPGTTLLQDLQKARWYLDREITRQQKPMNEQTAPEPCYVCNPAIVNGSFCATGAHICAQHRAEIEALHAEYGKSLVKSPEETS